MTFFMAEATPEQIVKFLMSSSTKDYAIVHEPDGSFVVHRADCTVVRLQANQGYPVATLLDCQEEPSKSLKRHDCLKA